jgi:hypothetical protein
VSIRLVVATQDYINDVYSRIHHVPPGRYLDAWVCHNIDRPPNPCNASLADFPWAVYELETDTKAEWVHLTGKTWCPNCIRASGRLTPPGFLRDVYLALGLVKA